MNRNTLHGMACGIGAGALWGLVFLAPELSGAFGPLELTVGRYLCYGLISAALVWPRRARLLAGLTRRDWHKLALLAFSGNTLYFILVAIAVQTGGVATTALVIGFLPVAVTIIGSRERGAVPLMQLLPSLLLCTAGAFCIGWEAIASGDAPLGARLTGLLCAAGALASWTAYAVANARCLAQLTRMSAHDWSLLTGLVTGAQSLLLLPAALLMNSGAHAASEWLQFGAVSIGVAILASIAGNALWNRMSQLLPLTLIGQMILFETLFALVYAFLWEWRLPTPLETLAFALVVMSVLSCLAAHRTHAANLLADAAAH